MHSFLSGFRPYRKQIVPEHSTAADYSSCRGHACLVAVASAVTAVLAGGGCLVPSVSSRFLDSMFESTGSED